jgi:hypothetical protein
MYRAGKTESSKLIAVYTGSLWDKLQSLCNISIGKYVTKLLYFWQSKTSHMMKRHPKAS